MRDRETIHHEIDDAQADLEATLSELKDVVKHEADPALNAERALQYGERKLRDLLRRAWAELLALAREIRHTAEHAGLRAALREIWDMLRAATRDLLAAV